MKLLYETLRFWTILFLILLNVNTIHGQDEFALAVNNSLSDYLVNMWEKIMTFFGGPRPAPIRSPVKSPVKAPKSVPVPVPVPTPKSVPVPIPTPKAIPVPVSTPKSVPVPVPTPKSVPVPVPTPKSVPVPVPTPKSVPVPIPTPKAVPVPVPTPKSVPVPVPTPKSVPVPIPTPKAVPVPVPTPKAVPVPTPKAAPVPIPIPLTVTPQITTLYTHGDAPYAPDQAIRLEAQMKSVPNDAEFIVFVGDLRKAGVNITCRRDQYDEVARLFSFSPVPVFVIIGDNDSNDCPNVAEGLQYWNDNFINFESRFWDHSFSIRRQDGYPDNFAFTHKKSLFIGLNIIGGLTRDTIEWEVRLSSEAMWTISMIRDYLNLLRQMGEGNPGRIVIFGHADPGGRHAPFFQPMATFIENELKNQVPILYVNGDKHEWTYTTSFYGKSSWLRIGVEGLATDPLLKLTINGNGKTIDPVQAFAFDRRL